MKFQQCDLVQVDGVDERGTRRSFRGRVLEVSPGSTYPYEVYDTTTGLVFDCLDREVTEFQRVDAGPKTL